MRQGQQNRRGRNRGGGGGGGRKPQNSMTRNYESSGPDVKIRGTAMHIAEKYTSLARDAMSSGDVVAAENYLQHAEHYNRIILAAQVQHGGMSNAEGQHGMNGNGRFYQPESFQRDMDGDGFDGEGDDFAPPHRQFHERHEQRNYQERPVYNHNQPQPYIPQNAFPQVQPQAPVPATNGTTVPTTAETAQTPAPDVERMPRRRRRRPMVEGEPRAYNGKNGAAHNVPGTNGSAPAGDLPPDEQAS